MRNWEASNFATMEASSSGKTGGRRASRSTRVMEQVVAIAKSTASGQSRRGAKRFDMLSMLPFELKVLVSDHLEPVDLITARRVSTSWNRLLSSTEFLNAAVCHHFPGQPISGAARIVDPGHTLASSAKRLHAFKTGRPVKKASFQYTMGGATPFFASNSSAVFADYFQGRIAWSEGDNIYVLYLVTGEKVHFICPRTSRLHRLKLSDRLVVVSTTNGKWYAFDYTNGQVSSINVGKGRLAWVAVRGLDLAFRSNEKADPLVLWRFGDLRVRSIVPLTMAGPLLFYPKKDIVSIYFLQNKAKRLFMGTWASFEYGDIATIPPSDVPGRRESSDSDLSRSVSYVSVIPSSIGSTDGASKMECSFYEDPDEAGTVIMDKLDDGTHQFSDGKFYGHQTVWWYPFKQTLRRYYDDQVGFLHKGTMYTACGEQKVAKPIMIQDMTSAAPAREVELSQICHTPVQPGETHENQTFHMDTGFRAALIGDDTFMVQIGYTHINVWCFDESIPLINEVVEYGQEAKKRAAERIEERAEKRRRAAFKKEIKGRQPPISSTLVSPASSVRMSPTPSMQISQFPESEPKVQKKWGHSFSLKKKTKSVVKKDGIKGEKDQSSSKPTIKHFSLRRGIYNLAVKTMDRIL